jgi:predicted dehydrogenase
MSIRVAVVGVGNLGQHHARVYHDLKEATLVGVVDSSPERAKEIAKKQKTQAFTSLEELFKAGVDAVSVVVPTFLHHEVTKACLEAGCHVLLEKPIASTLEQADDLTRLAREKGKVLQIGHIERFNQAIQALHQLKTVPRFIESHRMGPFVARNLDTGVVLDLMIHDIDIILNLVQSKVVSVEGVGIPVLSPTEDIANARIKFESGCIADLTASRISPEKMRKIRVFQEDAYLSIDYIEQGVELVRKKTGKAPLLGGMQFGDVYITREKMPIEKGDSLQKEIHDFLECVKTGREPQVTGEHGREALALALEITSQIKKLGVRS